MDDLSTWPGETALWPDGYTPSIYGASYVSDAVTEFFREAAIPGLWSIYPAEPINWADPANFFGPGVPFGVGAYVVTGKERQGKVYQGEGKPTRTVTHEVTVVGLFKSTLNDSGAVVAFQRRIEDDMKDAVRNSPKLGGRVWEAGIKYLNADRDTPRRDASDDNHNIWFRIDFEVTVFATPTT